MGEQREEIGEHSLQGNGGKRSLLRRIGHKRIMNYRRHEAIASCDDVITQSSLYG